MDTKTLIEKSISGTSLTSQNARSVIDTFAGLLADSGAEMDSVAVPGFGNFEPKKRLERINIQPSSGRRMLLPPKIVLSFRPSAILKSKLK